MDIVTNSIYSALGNGPSRPRDTQRSKVYAAEGAAFGRAKEELTLDECRAFIAEVWRSETAKQLRHGTGRQWRVYPPRLADGRGCRSASAGNGEVTLPRWARSKWVILHELSHEITEGRRAAHGPEFCRSDLRLVERFIGFEARERLGAKMRKRGVRTRP